MSFDVNAIRDQFPSINRPVDNDNVLPIYFDNPGGTQVPQVVIDAVGEYYREMNGNGGGHFATSKKTDAMTMAARQKVADFLNAPSADEIVFGPNMTTLNFALSRALAKTLSSGDEIVLTRMDHDANVTPWTRIAEDYDLTVRWVDIRLSDATLDMNTLEAALTEKTKIVATAHASNAVGTINPVRQIADMARAAGAIYVVDAVQSTPHIPIDVQELGCDFLLCSAYKFYGPHIGVMWGRYDLLAELPVYKVRPAKDKPPIRWETGTPSYETIHAVAAVIDYLAEIGRIYGADYRDEFSAYTARRLELKQGMAVLRDYEHDLLTHLLDMLQTLPGVTIAGITDPARYDQRVPTVAMVMDEHTPSEIAQHLAKNHIYVWDGNYYAVEIMKRLGREEHGMLRIGLAHYNTHAEIDRLERTLKRW
ncbi:MAG: cysteine desulfurase-like protein [Chloroflexi bacterium]|nr:MAG: cysteine desulfurase-like protein [Chloroflexota bacterium]